MEQQRRRRHLRNIGIEIVLGANAQLNHVRLAPAAAGAVQVEEVAMRLARDARYHAHYASFGAKLSRLELDIALEGEGAEAHLSGVSVLGDESHADITTHMHHAVGNTQAPNCSRMWRAAKAAPSIRARSRWRKGADGADSRQTAKALLLGNARRSRSQARTGNPRR